MSRVLRGMRWRLGTTVTCFVIVLVAVATALWAPTFAHSAGESLARQRINEQPSTKVGLSWVSTPRKRGADALAAAITGVERLTSTSGGTLERPTVGLVASANPAGSNDRLGGLPLTWRAGQCTHIVLTGRCPSAANEVLVPSDLAKARGWSTGSTLPMKSPMFDPQDTASARLQRPVTVRIVGTWAAKNPDSDYWFDASRYRGNSSLPTRTSCTDPPATPQFAADLSPILASRATFDSLASVSVIGDTRPARNLDLETTGTAVRATRRAVAENSRPPTASSTAAGCPFLVQTSDLEDVVGPLHSEQDRLNTIAAVVTASLALLGLFAVCLVVATIATQRRSEVAVAKLRGMRRWPLLRFMASENLLAVVAGVVAGFAVGYLICPLTIRFWLAHGTTTAVTARSLEFAGGVGLASLVAVLVAVWVVNRGPVSEHLTRTSHKHALSVSALTAQVLVLGVGAGLLLQVRTAGTAHGGWLSLSSAAVLAIAAAVVTIWVIGVTATVWTASTAGRPGDASFIASRRSKRRRDTAALVSPLVAALVVAAFAAGAAHAAGTWRHDAAAVRNGAAVRIDSTRDAFATLLATRTADPKGRWLMAAEVSGEKSNSLDRRGFADLSRWDRVAAPAMGSVTGAKSDVIGSAFDRDTWRPPMFSGTNVTLHGVIDDRRTNRDAPAEIRLDVLDRAGTTHLVPLTQNGDRYEADVAYCGSGCVLRQVVVGEKGDLDLVGTVTVVLKSFEADGRRTSIGFDPHGWRAAQRPGNDPKPTAVAHLAGSGAGLTFTATGKAGSAVPAITPSSTPTVRKVILSDGLGLASLPGMDGMRGVKGIDGALVPAQRVASPTNVLLLGSVGMLGNLPDFVMESNPEQLMASVYVLARADTPASVLTALADQGIDTSHPRHIASVTSSLAHDSYAQGINMLRVLALGATLIAIALVVAMLLDQRRRRRREAATLRIVGIRLATIRRSLTLEIGVGMAVGVLVVVAMTALSLWRILPVLPLVARTTFDPRVDTAVPWVPLVVAVAAAGAVAFVGCMLLLRRVAATARPGSLREEAD